MFVQVVQGKAKDPAGLKKQWERWEEEIRPGATGFLGATGGVSTDGQFITLARFETQEAARSNSERPEQDAWWQETSQYLEEPKFHDCTEVDVQGQGGADTAGFVQIMQGQTTDIQKARQLDTEMEDRMKDLRPDVVGSYTAWHPENGRFTTAIYFTTEAEARAKEKEMEADKGAQEFMQQWQEISAAPPEFIDLTDPWMS